MTGQWMTTKQVAEESGRAVDSVKRALARGLLKGRRDRTAREAAAAARRTG